MTMTLLSNFLVWGGPVTDLLLDLQHGLTLDRKLFKVRMPKNQLEL